MQALGANCPEIHIDLANSGPTLTLRAEDYGGRGADGGSQHCDRRAITELDLPTELATTFILGEPVLRRYYSVFDWGERRIGFGLAREETAEEAEAGQAAAEAEAAAVPLPEEIVAETEGPMSNLARALGLQVCMFLLLALSGRHGALRPLRQWLVTFMDEVMLDGRGLDLMAGLSRVAALESPEADDCAICLGSCEDERNGANRLPWRRMRCGHAFHEHCIHTWLRKAQHCPVCRSPTAPSWAGGGQRRPSEREMSLAAINASA